MSLLFPEHIRIGLGASYAVLAQVRRNRVENWRMQSWSVAGGVSPWQQPLEAVLAWLGSHALRGARVKVSLSAELAPLHLLPWRTDIVLAEQQAMLAAAHFHSIYGESVEHWKTAVQPLGYGMPWLAGATDERLLSALNERLQGAGATLASVTPLSISLFNALRSQLKGPACWLLIPEPSRLGALHLRNGQWSILKAMPRSTVGHDLQNELLRETRLAALPDMPTQVYFASEPPPMADQLKNTTILDPGWRQNDAVPAGSPLHLLGARS